MTIRQQGGVFGRNPSFNDVDATQLDLSGNALVGGTLGVTGAASLSTASINALSTATALNVNSNNTPYGLDIGFLHNNSRIGSAGSAAGIDGTRSLTDFGLHGINNIDLCVGYTRIGSVTSSGIALANGKGIDFSATSGTGTSKLFDDYEEGDHEVVVTAGTSGTITVGASSSVLAYTKVGRQVTLMGRILIGSVSSPVGALKISLPFVIGNMTEFGGYVFNTNYFYGNGTGVSDGASYYTYAVSGTEGQSTISLFAISRAGVFDTTAADWLGANSEIYVNFTYFTS